MRFCSVLLIICFCSCFGMVNGQPGSIDSLRAPQFALLGGRGLVKTPSAYVTADKELNVAVTYWTAGSSQLDFSKDRRVGDKIYWINIGYLPFLEVSIQVTKPDHEDHFGIGDRSIFMKLNICKEKEHRPAISVGLNDPFGNGYYHAAYAVASKHIIVGKTTYLELTMGYGNRINTAQNYYLEGAFAGAALNFKFLSANVEMESKQINLAAKATLFKKLYLNVAVLNGKALAGSFLFSTKI